MNNAGKVFTAFAAGAAIGAVIGVLFAPDKGSNTRKKMKDEGKRVMDNLEDSIQQAKDKLDKIKSELEQKVKQYTEKQSQTNTATKN